MGRRSPDCRLRAAALLLAAALLAGCSAPGVGTPSADLVTRLDAALAERSLDGFLAAFPSGTDGRERGTSWYTALSHGDGHLAQGDAQLTVTTMFPGDRRTASQTITYQLDGDRVSAVSRTQGTPLWALEATDLTGTGSGTLLSAGIDQAARSVWATRLDHAVTAVVAAGVPGAEGWPRGLVVEVPGSPADFRLLTGSEASSASAVTTCEGGTPRIVVSPEARGLDAGWLDSTLVHEAVHVATDSACVAGGASLEWAVEGLAESVAARVDPATASRNRGLVADYLAAHGVPDALPVRLESLTDYALAQLAVDQVRAHLGSRADDLLDRAVHDAASVGSAERREITGWYVAELRRRSRG